MYIYIYTYIHTYMHIYMYMCIFIYPYVWVPKTEICLRTEPSAHLGDSWPN